MIFKAIDAKNAVDQLAQADTDHPEVLAHLITVAEDGVNNAE